MINEVSIYIYTTVKGPKKRYGAYAYLLEVDTNKGPATCSDTGRLENVTEHQAELIALAAALKRMYKRCDLKIYTDSTHVAVCAEKWLDRWRRNDWKNARGKSAANKKEWKELTNLLNEHKYQFIIGEKHSYYQGLKSEAERVEKKCIQ